MWQTREGGRGEIQNMGGMPPTIGSFKGRKKAINQRIWAASGG